MLGSATSDKFVGHALGQPRDGLGYGNSNRAPSRVTTVVLTPLIPPSLFPFRVNGM